MAKESSPKREMLIKVYSVHVLAEEGINIIEQTQKPLLGGYLSMKKYGNPDYCPSATRHHKKAKEQKGEMPNLVYFNSVETAVAKGFSPCGNCWIKGEKAEERWQEYLDACKELNIPSITPAKIISR